MTKNRTPTPVYLDPGMHPGLEVKGLMRLWVWNTYLVLLWNRALAYPWAPLPSGGLLSCEFWQLTTPLNFVLRVAPENYDAYYKYAIIFTNVLQTINLSFHFVLYCLINVTLRRTPMALVYACLQRLSAVPTESPPYEPTRLGSSASFNSKNVVSNKLYDTTVVWMDDYIYNKVYDMTVI